MVISNIKQQELYHEGEVRIQDSVSLSKGLIKSYTCISPPGVGSGGKGAVLPAVNDA